MSRISVLVVVLVALVGCSAPPPKAPAAVAEADGPSTFSPDQDVPLLAPDETEAKTPPRLTQTKRIGGGPDDTSVDGKHRGATTQAQTRASTSSAPRPRSFFRGTGYSSSSNAGTTSSSSGSSAPAVGGNFPSAPSFGSPAAR